MFFKKKKLIPTFLTRPPRPTQPPRPKRLTQTFGLRGSLCFLSVFSLLGILSLLGLLGIFWGCGLPDPFEENSPSAPNISGYSDGKKIFLIIKGDYPSAEFPNFSGLDVYLGDNNDVKEIQKRILHISKKDERPSRQVNLFNEEFPLQLEFADPFQFRMTSLAKEADLSDEGVKTVEELITNKDHWTVAPGKIFYFAVKAVTKQAQSPISETVEVSVPIETTASIPYNQEHTIKIQNSDEEKIKITFLSKERGQKVNFTYVKGPNSSSTDNAYIESLSMITDTRWEMLTGSMLEEAEKEAEEAGDTEEEEPQKDVEWKKILLPKKNFSKSAPVYAEHYLIFAQLQKKSVVNFYLKIFVKEATDTHVDVVIHKFNKK